MRWRARKYGHHFFRRPKLRRSSSCGRVFERGFEQGFEQGVVRDVGCKSTGGTGCKRTVYTPGGRMASGPACAAGAEWAFAYSAPGGSSGARPRAAAAPAGGERGEVRRAFSISSKNSHSSMSGVPAPSSSPLPSSPSRPPAAAEPAPAPRLRASTARSRCQEAVSLGKYRKREGRVSAAAAGVKGPKQRGPWRRGAGGSSAGRHACGSRRRRCRGRPPPPPAAATFCTALSARPDRSSSSLAHEGAGSPRGREAAGGHLRVDAHVLAAGEAQGEDLRGLPGVLLSKGLEGPKLSEHLRGGGRRAVGAWKGARGRLDALRGLMHALGTEPSREGGPAGMREQRRVLLWRMGAGLLHLRHGSRAVHELAAFRMRQLVRRDEAQQRDCLPRPRRHLQTPVPLRFSPTEAHIRSREGSILLERKKFQR